MKIHHDATSTSAPARPVYFISNRPEAYEITGEVSREEAGMLARLIAERAGKRFPGIEFRIDGEWHSHDRSTELAAEYIEGHWQAWAATMVDHKQTA